MTIQIQNIQINSRITTEMYDQLTSGKQEFKSDLEVLVEAKKAVSKMKRTTLTIKDTTGRILDIPDII